MTMGQKYTRGQLLEKLKHTINEGKPIVAAGAGCGLQAKCEEIGGADLVLAFSSSKSRLMGTRVLFFLGVMDCNAIVLELGEELSRATEVVPIIAGINGADPTRNMNKYLDRLIEIGFSGIINFPSSSLLPESLRGPAEDFKIGFTRELETMKLAQEKGLLTMCYVIDPKDAQTAARADSDCICIHEGWTVGGLMGAKVAKSLTDAVAHIQEIAKAARSVKSDIIILAHGGPISSPEDTKYIYENTDAAGFLGCSSIDRIPIEKSVIEAVKSFKRISLQKKSSV